MSRKIKLIWDFFGNDAENTAIHHAKHLKEFGEKENLTVHDCGINKEEQLTEAFMVIDEENMIAVRDALKPKRGQWVD